MTDTSQELAEKAVHEQRMRDDAEYFKQFVNDKLEFYLNTVGDFIDLDARYEVVTYGQLMRALRSLDVAVRKFGLIYNCAASAAPSVQDIANLESARRGIDAVFTSLNNIQQNLIAAVTDEAKKEMT